MKQEAEPIPRPQKRHEAANMKDALEAMERSGSIHFLKTTFPQTSIPALAQQSGADLTLPAEFVREHGDKVEEWIILRVQSCNGKSSRPWTMQLSIMFSDEACTVRFAGTGWEDFAAGSGLRMGDSVIFLLKEGVRSEFEVHLFRGPEGTPYFPDVSNSSSSSDDDDNDDKEEKYISNSNSEEEERFAENPDEDDEKQCRVRTHPDAHNRASSGYGRDGKAATGQQTKHSRNDDEVFPSFRKVLTVNNIRHSARLALTSRSGQFELPRHFVRSHGEHIQASVQLQGVHEDSPVDVIPCSRSTRAVDGHMTIYFKSREWNRFVIANRLSVGQELQFSLTADSYFKVRVI